MRVTSSAILTALLAVAGAVLPADAQDIPRHLEGGESNFYQNSVELALAPDNPMVSEIRSGLDTLDPRVGIEIALDIPVAERAFSPEGLLEVYNILRSVSSTEGIEYYSASRGEMRTFYEESYAVEGPDGTTRIPDPVVDRIPDRSEVWVYQHDGSFGRNVQRLEYRSDGENFLVAMENETTMVYKVVPLVRPGNLRTFLLVTTDPDRGVLSFYGNIGVRVPAMFGMEDRARDSFYNRIVAMHDWFAAELRRAGLATEPAS